MGDTIVIETPVATVLEVSGLQGPQGVPGATGATGATGPQGPAGTGIETLTTKGDLLSRNDSAAIRVGIGSTGQVLKVASSGLPAWENESGGVPTSRTISAGTGLTGGGDLSANRTLSVSYGSSNPAALGTASAGSSNDVSRADHVHSAEVTDSAFRVTGSTDATKKVAIEVDTNVPANTTVTLTAPSASGTLALAGDAPAAHAASHASAGSDPLFDQDLNTTDSPDFTALSVGNGEVALSNSGGSWRIGNNNAYLDFENGNIEGFGLTARQDRFSIVDQTDNSKAATFDASGIATSTTRAFSLPNASGTLMLVGDAPASHTHGNLTNDGKLGSTSGLPVVTTTAGAVTTLALGTANQVLRVNSGATGVEFADPAASGVTGAAASASDVLGVSGANITGVDANADRIVFWDDSASALKYLEAGSGLSISGTTLAATASGGSKTYAVFTAEHNQPPSTAFATLDTRNSIAVLDFDAATDENAVFVGIMPEAASLGSGLIVRLHWMATSATSGNVRWGVQFERSNTDLDADSFDTAVEATAATNGTSGIITTTAITVTTIDGITAGDVFRLKVYRNADDATNDTMTGDAELVAVEVRSAA